LKIGESVFSLVITRFVLGIAQKPLTALDLLKPVFLFSVMAYLGFRFGYYGLDVKTLFSTSLRPFLMAGNRNKLGFDKPPER